jgi:AAA+ superfamily predicted ATPase
MNDIFDEVIELPDPKMQQQFVSLVGLDYVKARLLKEGELLLNPNLLDKWSKSYHKKVLPIIKKFHERPPLIIFSGDVGTGKTSLAECFGDPIARAQKITVRVMHISLNARGSGAVGEMTRLVTSAFKEVEQVAEQGYKSGQKPTSSTIMIIDEADSLAQSRDNDQMHHEDRAGVNALIRGVDRFTNNKLPVVIVMCTNRVEAIDPAIMRRAGANFSFKRPNKVQRMSILNSSFEDVFTEEEINNLAESTGKNGSYNYGYTYSDLTQRLIPSAILEAYPDKPITFELVMKLIGETIPTKPFNLNNLE